MLKRLVAILFFAMSMTACNGGGVPSRSEVETLLREKLADEHLYGGKPIAQQADFALDRVTGITNPDANTLRVEFLFHWVPTTDYSRKRAAITPKSYSDCMGVPGAVWGGLNRWCDSLSSGAIATAEFKKYDDGWRLVRVYA